MQPQESGANSEQTKTDAAHAPGAAAPIDGPDPEELRTRLRETEAQHVRLAADFANFRKRTRQVQSDTALHAARSLAARLLPVLDDGERALQHPPAGVDPNWLKGIELTFRTLRDELASVAVEPIEAVGSQFDPKLHEAIATEESAEHPEGTVVEELRRGYRIRDEVLRPSLGRIARRPAQDDSQPGEPQAHRPRPRSG